jgi:hypothetical protein
MSMQVVNEDQYTPAVYYGAGSHTLTKEGIGTRYAAVVVRMLVDQANPQDVQQVHALQDALKVSQQERDIAHETHEHGRPAVVACVFKAIGAFLW